MIDDRETGPDPSVTEVATPFVTLSADLRPECAADGTWRYQGTSVPIPGATDVTVADVVDYLLAAPPAGDPRSVLIHRREVQAHHLSWVEESGRLLRANDDEDDLFEVPWPVWQEHASAAVDVYLPERDAIGLDRILAAEERDVRLLRHALEVHAERRTWWVLVATRFGMTRRAIGDLLGLSAARVQQLVDDAPPRVRVQVDDLVADVLCVLRGMPEHWVPIAEVPLPASRDERFVDLLVDMELLEHRADRVRVTDEGERVELHLRTQPKGRSRRG